MTPRAKFLQLFDRSSDRKTKGSGGGREDEQGRRAPTAHDSPGQALQDLVAGDEQRAGEAEEGQGDLVGDKRESAAATMTRGKDAFDGASAAPSCTP